MSDAAAKVDAVYGGTFEEYALETLRNRYHPETFAQLRVNHGVQTWNNVLRDLVTRLAVAWSEGATYYLTATDGSEYAGPEFSDFLRQAEFTNLMKRMDVMTELHPRVLVGPDVVPNAQTGKRKLVWRVCAPGQFYAETVSGTGVVREVAVYGEEERHGRIVRTKREWSAEEVESYTEQNGSWVLQAREDNPYRCIPFVLFGRDKPVSSLWCDVPGPALADVTIEVCAWETFLGYIGSGQIKVLSGELEQLPSGQSLHHAGVVSLGNAQNINMLDFQTDVERFVRVYINRMRDAAAISVGLDPQDYIIGADQPSAVSLDRRHWNRDKRARNKRSFLVSYLTELYWVTQQFLSVQMAMADSEPIEGLAALPPYDAATGDTKGLSFSVDVNEIQYPESVDERAKREDRDLALGLTNRAEMYLQRNPDLTMQQAAEAVLRNAQVEARLASMATRPVGAADKTLGRILGG